MGRARCHRLRVAVGRDITLRLRFLWVGYLEQGVGFPMSRRSWFNVRVPVDRVLTIRVPMDRAPAGVRILVCRAPCPRVRVA